MMDYTVRNIPDDVADALGSQAKREHCTLNQVVIHALRIGLGRTDPPQKRRDLSSCVGTWVHDPQTEAALREQDQIDPEAWR